MANQHFTREQILKLAVGDMLLVGGRSTSRVTRIYARGISDKGNAYVCFYREFGPHSQISGSLVEGGQSEFYTYQMLRGDA